MKREGHPRKPITLPIQREQAAGLPVAGGLGLGLGQQAVGLAESPQSQ